MESAVRSDPEVTAGSLAIRLVRGDITMLDVDAFVFYAQGDLVLGSGFGGAIAVRGGASIQKELNELASGGPLSVGSAVVTGAGKLKARHIIHAVGPRFKEADTESKLRRTVQECLQAAAEKEVKILAFPLMGSGYYGIPPAVSARVMLEAFESISASSTGLQEIVVCVFDTPQLTAFEAAQAARA
jgi:O-acetyl-ADP-ribose deacetylase